jgi:enoyl-CoA hydratase/carnithine racemase
LNEYTTLRYAASSGVGTLRLARPGVRNAINPSMWRELRALGAELIDDRTLRCLIVSAEGPSFCAGMDLRESMAGPFAGVARGPLDEATTARAFEVASTFEWIPRLACPSIAAVRGHAYGAGMQLALGCDLRVLSDTARLALIENRYGLIPDMGATFRLPRLVGDGRARQLILLGDIVDATEAERIGLANYVVPDSELEQTVTNLAARLADQSSTATVAARRAIGMAWDQDAATNLRFAVSGQITCLRSPEFAAAVSRLRETRTTSSGRQEAASDLLQQAP